MSDTSQHPDLSQILSSDLRAFVDNILHEEGGIDHFRELLSDEQLSTLESRRKLDLVTRAGVSITRERDVSNILEITLNTARNLTNADAGTIYIVEEIFSGNPIDPGEIADRTLKFVGSPSSMTTPELSWPLVDLGSMKSISPPFTPSTIHDPAPYEAVVARRLDRVDHASFTSTGDTLRIWASCPAISSSAFAIWIRACLRLYFPEPSLLKSFERADFQRAGTLDLRLALSFAASFSTSFWISSRMDWLERAVSVSA